MTKENEKLHREETAHEIAENIYNYTLSVCRGKDLGPIDLIAALAICIVNANFIYSARGQEKEAFEGLVNGMRVLFEDILSQIEIAAAMLEKSIAQDEGKIQ
jgi:hypothetical protein